MLRLIVLLLLLANGAYFLWARGLLLPWGLGPTQQSEPQRVEQQIQPDAVRVLPRDELRRIEAMAVVAARQSECLQAGPMDDTRVAGLRPLLAAWPPGAWALEPTVEPPRWIVYMGRFANAEQVARKKAQLRQLGISFENLANAELEPGLSLGGHPSEQVANQQLETLAQRGVRTARVVLERPEVRGQRLVLAAVDDSLRPRLEELKPVLQGRPLRPCR